jgi:hypothetical protein
MGERDESLRDVDNGAHEDADEDSNCEKEEDGGG